LGKGGNRTKTEQHLVDGRKPAIAAERGGFLSEREKKGRRKRSGKLFSNLFCQRRETTATLSKGSSLKRTT